MRHRIVISLMLVTAAVSAGPEPTRFIPWSPLEPELRAQIKEQYQKGKLFDDAQIEEMLNDTRSFHTFRERDIVAAYPELRGGRKLSSCSNRIMSGSTSIVFLSEVEEHRVTVQRLACMPAENGLRCGTVMKSRNYFLTSPRESIAFEGVSLDTVKTIAKTYEAKRVDQLPEWIEGRFPRLSVVGSRPNGLYGLYFGDVHCGGCFARYDARLDLSGQLPRLVFAGNADDGCY